MCVSARSARVVREKASVFIVEGPTTLSFPIDVAYELAKRIGRAEEPAHRRLIDRPQAIDNVHLRGHRRESLEVVARHRVDEHPKTGIPTKVVLVRLRF